MVFLGLEKPVEYGAQQIFDPTMANMVLQTQQHYNEAARAEYERGLRDFDTFLTKYGDFISPFAKDMARYGEMVGNIQNTINQAYKDGIDLLRSPEGRMLVRQLTNSIDPAEFNTMRANAKVGFEYLDAIEKAKAKNEFNQAFEDYALTNGGPGLFSEFSSAGGKMWNRPAPYVYQDLNQYTGHIFDKMDDSYIGTGADHYDYYGVSREARQQALTQHLSGLLSTPLGQFHYQNSKANLERVLGREATPEEAMAAYQNDILTATTEYEHRNRKLNEAWKLQQENAARRSAGGGGYQPNQQNQYSIAELIRRTASTRIVGQQTQEYGRETLARQRDAQIQNGLNISKATGGHSNTYKGRQMFRSTYQDNNYSAAALTDFIVNQGFQRDESKANTVIVPRHMLGRLSTLAELTSRTTGYRGNMIKTNYLKQKLGNADVVRITFTGGDYGAYMKNATNQNHFECEVEVGKKDTFQKDPNDPTTRMSTYIWTPVKVEGAYFDSHITSQPDDPRAGYLGTVDKKGKVTPTPNIPITNSQDTKYQDAVMSDVYTTSQYVKGSDYNFDAPYTELTNYPSKP